MKLAEYRSEIRKLLHAKQDQLPALIEGVTQILQARGCAYWLLSPKPESNQEIAHNPKKFRLYTVASWFVSNSAAENEYEPEAYFGFHDLPLETTNSGAAVLQNRVISGYDPILQPDKEPQLPFVLRDHKIFELHGVCFASVAPVYEGDLLIGAVSVYRNGPPPAEWADKEKIHSPEAAEAETLQDVALLLPTLFDSAITAKRMKATTAVLEVFKQVEIEQTGKQLQKETAQVHLKTLVKSLNEIFQCLEVSIFLERLDTPSTTPTEFYPLATNWYTESQVIPHSSKETSSLTGWVLKNKQPVWIANLRTFEEEKERYQHLFPGIEHTNSLHLDYSKGDFPISFMAAPILLGTKLMGCIRCISNSQSPHYYTESDAEALSHAGSLLATAWHRWQLSWKIQNEALAWENFLKSLNKTLTETLSLLNDKQLSREQMLGCILSIVPDFVSAPGTPSVHLLDPKTRHLQQAYPPTPADTALDPRFYVDFPRNPKKPESLAVSVFASKTATYFAKVRKNRLYAKTIEPDDTEDLIICPIHLSGKDDEPMGVLSIRGKTTIPDGKFVKQLAATLALQTAIFLRFLDTIREAQTKTDEAKEIAEKLRMQEGVLKRVFEDVRHQIKAPLNKAMMQVGVLMSHHRVKSDDVLRREMAVLRGLCRKATGVAGSVKLLADIEAGRPLITKKTTLEKDKMLLLLVQMAEDHETEADPDSLVYFGVNREGLDKLPWSKFSADLELLEQVFFCLCDNALKYSFPRTRVTLAAKVTQGGRLRFTVSNTGTKVTLEESKRILRRGERGEAAQHFRGEGSGIGLFLVDQIAQAHEGSFQIQPTDSNKITVAEFIIK